MLARSGCPSLLSASRSAARTTTYCTWWASRRPGRSRRRSADSVIRRESSETRPTDVHRRGVLRSAVVAAAAALGSAASRRARPRTRHTYGSTSKWMSLPRASARCWETFHNVVRAGSGEARGLHPREDAQAAGDPAGDRARHHNYRFELEFESEELRQKWIASAGPSARVAPGGANMTTLKNYPVVLDHEVGP